MLAELFGKSMKTLHWCFSLSLLTTPGYEPKFRPLCTHLSCDMSSLCLISLSYFLYRVVLPHAQVSSSFIGLFWSWPTCLHFRRHVCDVRKDKTAHAKSRDRKFAVSHPVNKMPIYPWQIRALRCWHSLAGCFQMLELVWIWNPFGCESPGGMKYFVTQPCRPAMEIEENALGYSLLTNPKQSRG